jgi:hypothetical protein
MLNSLCALVALAPIKRTDIKDKRSSAADIVFIYCLEEELFAFAKTAIV